MRSLQRTVCGSVRIWGTHVHLATRPDALAEARGTLGITTHASERGGRPQDRGLAPQRQRHGRVSRVRRRAPLGQTPPAGRSVGRSRPVHSPARCRRCPPPGSPLRLRGGDGRPLHDTNLRSRGARPHPERPRSKDTPGRAGPAVGDEARRQAPLSVSSPGRRGASGAARRQAHAGTSGARRGSGSRARGKAKPSGAPLRGRRVCAPRPHTRPGAPPPPHTRPHRGCAPDQRVRACTRLSQKRTLA